MKAPFPWFGGKSRVQAQVCDRFGDVRNYVEPFAGSLSVLLGRPDDVVHFLAIVKDAVKLLEEEVGRRR